MSADTSEKGLETLIIHHMTGVDGIAVASNMVAEAPAPYGGAGYIAGSAKDYYRAHALMDKLPEVMSEKQKNMKSHNLMAELVRKGKIENRGSRAKPAWHTAKKLAFNKGKQWLNQINSEVEPRKCLQGSVLFFVWIAPFSAV